MALLILFAATAAQAQQVSRPYRTIFGPGDRDLARADQLTLTGSTYSGLDDTAALSSGSVLDDTLQSNRGHQGATVAIGFVRRRPRLTTTSFASSAVRYYHSLSQIGTQRHGGGFGTEWRASQRLTLRARQDASYSPSYQLSINPLAKGDLETAPEPASLDYNLFRSKQITYGSGASARYVWNDSREVSAGYSLNYTDYFSQPNFALQQASARFTQRLTAGLALNMGYGAGTGTVVGPGGGIHHDLDLGLSLDRAFSVSPRTVFGFNSGSAIVKTERGRQLELVGGAQLRRRLTRRWTTSLSYQRGITTMEALRRPLIANTMTADLSGFLGANTSVTISPVFTWGADVADSSRTYQSSTSVARLQTAVSRHWAVYAEYMHYDHRFGALQGLPPSLAANLRRDGVRAGLALWAPLDR